MCDKVDIIYRTPSPISLIPLAIDPLCLCFGDFCPDCLEVPSNDYQLGLRLGLGYNCASLWLTRWIACAAEPHFPTLENSNRHFRDLPPFNIPNRNMKQAEWENSK